MYRTNGRRTVAIAPSLIDHATLETRVREALRDVSTASLEVLGEVRPTTSARPSDRLRDLDANVAQPVLERGAGIHGMVSFHVKRIVRKLTRWYVDAPWRGQHEFNSEAARLVGDAAGAIEELERRIAHLESWNGDLLRRLRRLERDRQEERVE